MSSFQISYVDYAVHESDWRGCSGWFTLSNDLNGSFFDVSFDYDANQDSLCMGDCPPDVWENYRDAFLADAKEAYRANCDELRSSN